MKTTICGNYPKIDHKKSKINLRLAINKKDKGRISDEEFDRIMDATKKRTINDQIDCGIDFLTDGQITWTDLLSPYCQALDNVEAGGIRRFFDNNIYYRRPQIVGKMERNKGIIVDDIESVRSFCTTPVKAVMCGPITFAALSDDFHYKSFENVADAVSDIIREELLEVDKLGVEYIQIDEPSLPEYPQYFNLAVKALENIFDGINAKCGLAFYFTSLKSIADELHRLPVDFMAVDFVSHPEILGIYPPLENFELHAGLIDARDLRLENKSDITTKIDYIKKTIKPKEIVLTTSCGLEFLPRNYAMAKMEHLSKIAQNI